MILFSVGAFAQKDKQGENGGALPKTQQDSLNEVIQIDRIFIVGNKRTKERIIKRELDIYEGQILTKALLQQYVEEDKRKIFNTALFNDVDITVIDLLNGKADVIIRVTERWYFFPVPIFALADRNFTEWWVNQERDFSRVEYGLRLRHYNFRGRNEKVDLTAQFGYTKLFRLFYLIPYIDRQQKVGISFSVDYATNKNLAVNTEGHKLQFLDGEEIMRKMFRAGINLNLRPSFYNFHRFGFWFSNLHVHDTVAIINPDYLMDGNTSQRYIGFTYRFRRDLRDYKSYPLKGFFIEGEVNKYGLGFFGDVDILELNGSFSRYFDLGKKFYFSSNVSFLTSFPEDQPYRNYSGIGFGNNFMRGYEVYVIEGPHFVMNNNSLKKQIFSQVFDISNILGIRQFSKVPISVYLTAFYDHGYVKNYPGYEFNQRFTDTYLYGTGVGIDIVSFYDAVFRWEYSINKAGETGFRLNIHAAF